MHALPEAALPAALELYDRVLGKLRSTAGFEVGATAVRRPDGVLVALDRDRPLLTLGRLVQEDLCLMQRVSAEHALTAAVLCFPASWTLAEKLGRSMLGIHIPVESYAEDLARRVQRLFDAIRPEQPLWRMNFHIYESPALFHPRRESYRHPTARAGAYMRAERQCLLRLPQTGAVVFSIHTYQVRLDSLTPSDHAALGALGVMQRAN
ncbi:heme-dependent oxidative N-demethylase family protein [Cypionkella sp. TWP1-2-1b2]|uniref:heme-dependent oxidative N-demethylase family protein n=1 Tax=Cypionkella sp. TWP1-2-1b2 TaxID=2804675 RepID=UPI003CEBE821